MPAAMPLGIVAAMDEAPEPIIVAPEKTPSVKLPLASEICA